MNRSGLVRNEDGSVMVISIVILALLTIIGIAVTTTSSIELQIAGNDRIYKENFYLAEGAAMMLAQILENEDIKDDNFPNPDPDEPGEDKDIPGPNDLNNNEILEDRYWEGTEDKSCEAPGLSDTDHPPRFIAKKEGLAHGSSLVMTDSRLYAYSIFARRKKNNSVVVIELGYKKRF